MPVFYPQRVPFSLHNGRSVRSGVLRHSGSARLLRGGRSVSVSARSTGAAIGIALNAQKDFAHKNILHRLSEVSGGPVPAL